MNGADILVKTLEDLDVTTVYGYSGAAILPVFHALGASEKITVVTNSNEQSCAFAAAGVSRATDKVGVAIVTSGPAITNTLTAVADANADSIPMLVFAGQVASDMLGTDDFQHIDVTNVFAKAAKRVIIVTDACDIEEIVKDAYFYAREGKPGPVVIDYTIDAQRSDMEYKGLAPSIYQAKYDDERHLGKEQCKVFFELLKKAKRPLLYIGGGMNNPRASRVIREFNDIFAIPSINSLMGKGVLDAHRSTSLGMHGMYGVPSANKAILENDLFIGLGIRWNDRVSQKVGEAGIDADIAYIDINPLKVQEIRTTRFPKFSFIGDVATALEDLLEYAQQHPICLNIDEWRQRVVALKRQYPLAYNSESPIVQQAGVLAELAQIIPDNIRVATGVGNHQMLAAQYLKMARPKSFLTSGGFGTMGFALPTAVGAAVADPATPVLVIDGDSCLRMNMGEIYTIGTRKLPIKILMMNNRSAGMVRNIQTAKFGGRIVATDEPDAVSYANIAKECGFTHVDTLEKKEDIRDKLAQLLAAEGSGFLEVITDREEVLYPIIYPGTGYQDMVVGPYMQS